jgi:hypothetical protein
MSRLVILRCTRRVRFGSELPRAQCNPLWAKASALRKRCDMPWDGVPGLSRARDQPAV